MIAPTPTRVHLAVVRREYLAKILAGEKTAEARLTRTRRGPYVALQPGETVYFKAPGGPIQARARAARVHRFEFSTPGDLDRVRRRFERALGGPSPYWDERADARYAVIIELDRPEPTPDRPAWRAGAPLRSAWRVIEQTEQIGQTEQAGVD